MMPALPTDAHLSQKVNAHYIQHYVQPQARQASASGHQRQNQTCYPAAQLPDSLSN